MKKLYRIPKKYVQENFSGIYKIIDKYKIIIKYLISGGTAATTDLGLLYIFTEWFGIWYVSSAALAFFLAFFVSFFMQKFWTFRDTDIQKIKQQAGLYLVVALINLAINTGGMFFLVDRLNLWYIFAQIIMGALISVGSFIIYHFFIFATPKKNNQNKKNILICTGIYPPDIGGPATYVKILQEELPKHEFKIKVITYGEGKNSDDVIYISRQQNRMIRYIKYFWYVLNLLSWANIVYAQGPVSEGLPTYWACKLKKKKYILKIVGDYAWEQGQQRFNVKELLDDFQNKKYGSKVEKMRKIQRKVAQSAEKIIVPSKYLKKIVKQWGVDENKINVVYNSVEFKEVKAIEKPANEKWIISVGRLVPWKGMDILIEIMPELLKQEPNLKLKIIGDGPQREALQVESRKLKVENNVEFLGKISHDVVLGYLQVGDLFVLNTGYEGLPHTILEAMYSDIPVIATNICGNPEVISDNPRTERGKQTGLLVEYNNKEQIKNAILKLLNNQELAKELTINAKNSLDKFYKQGMINDIVKILKL